MKHFLIILETKPPFTILFIFSLITTKVYSEETLADKIKDICLKADSSVKSFFEEKQELPEKFKNLVFSEEAPDNEIKTAIKFLLIDEETRNDFILTKKNKNKFIKLSSIVIIIISTIIILNFEIHFFLRLCFKKDIYESSFTNFYKISPFYWILYINLNKEKANELYKKFLNNNNKDKKGRYFYYTFALIIFTVIAVIFAMTFFIYKENENSSQVTINVLCTSIKFLNELQNGKELEKKGNHLIGFKDISSFLNELIENKNLFLNYFNNYTEIDNEIKNGLKEWENYMIYIQNKLSDKNSSEYFFYNYPSDPSYIEQASCHFDNINSCKKNLFQTGIIYEYYPYDDSSTTLWEFNKNLNENIKILLEKLNYFENTFIKSENSLNFFFENENYKNGFSKINDIINIYIQQILEIDKENIFDKFVYSYLSYIYSFDFILLILLGLNTLLALLYVEYYCVKKFFFGRVVISTVFYNIMFMVLGLTLIETDMLMKINIKFSYIKEISKGIEYILNEDTEKINTLFDEKNNVRFKNISLIIQSQNEKMNNNLFNYIKYYINNEKELKILINDNILHLNSSKIIKVNTSLNEIINKNKSNIVNTKINDKFNESLLKLINNGLEHETVFYDLTGTGFLNSYIEYPLTYLTYVNLIVRKTARLSYHYYCQDISCDETWNVTTDDYYYDNYFYKPKEFVFCQNCSKKCSNNKYSLNFLEFSLKELEERYENIKDGKCVDSFYELMYYFTAADKLRSKEVFDQLKGLYEMNNNLINIQNNIFNIIEKKGYIAKNITTIYENILKKYEKEKAFFNYSEFIKDDLYYLIGQIEKNFTDQISKEYTKHYNINIMCICVCFSLFIFYVFLAKEMKYFQKENNEEETSSIEENAGASQLPIQNNSKKEQSKMPNKKTNQDLTNIVNVYIINDQKNIDKNKTLENNDLNRNKSNKSNTENAVSKNIQLYDNKKILLTNKFKESNFCSGLVDENRIDESRFDLTKGLIIENKKENVFNNVSNLNHKYLSTENIIIKNKK